MNSKVTVFLIGITLIAIFGFNTKSKPKFVFVKTIQGIILYESVHPIYFYQKERKTPDGMFYFNNYLYPLFSIGGDTLTEEFPVDHPHHRGIFWAWHQIYLNSQCLGDG